MQLSSKKGLQSLNIDGVSALKLMGTVLKNNA